MGGLETAHPFHQNNSGVTRTKPVFRKEGVCAGEPSGFPCAFNKKVFRE